MAWPDAPSTHNNDEAAPLSAGKGGELEDLPRGPRADNSPGAASSSISAAIALPASDRSAWRLGHVVLDGRRADHVGATAARAPLPGPRRLAAPSAVPVTSNSAGGAGALRHVAPGLLVVLRRLQSRRLLLGLRRRRRHADRRRSTRVHLPGLGVGPLTRSLSKLLSAVSSRASARQKQLA